MVKHLSATRIVPLAFLLVFVFVTGGANGNDNVPELENRRALQEVEYIGPFFDAEMEGQAPLHWGLQALRKAYSLPICVETHPMASRRTEVTYIPYKIQKNETLRHAVDKYVSLVGDVFEWRWIDGVPFIGPPLDENGHTGTNFDTIVSLNLNSVSVWDAFVILAIEIRANSVSDSPLFAVQPQCAAEYQLPPAAFLEEGHVSLSLSNVTAREAAIEIIKASPIEMYFILAMSTYKSGDIEYLSLFFTEDGKRTSLEPMDENERLFWDAEVQAVRDLIADAAPE